MTGTIEVRVRYDECDPMGVAHHSVYPVWFEMGRTELLRETTGLSYAELEADGVLLAVVRLEVRYRLPARYDDKLAVSTTVERVTRAKIEHTYALHCGARLLATARTAIACLNRDGRPQPLPAIFAGG